MEANTEKALNDIISLAQEIEKEDGSITKTDALNIAINLQRNIIFANGIANFAAAFVPKKRPISDFD